jgi:uncharacterized protein YuzE
MKKPKMYYLEQEDILHLVIAEEEEASSVELSPNVTAELNEKGELIGIEILCQHVCARCYPGWSTSETPQSHQP